MRIEAPNLQEAFQKAAEKLNCSVTEINVINVIQHPSSGFLGFFKKNAIIEVVKEGSEQTKKVSKPREKDEQKHKNNLDSNKTNGENSKKRNKNKKQNSSNSQNSDKSQPEKISTAIKDPFVESLSDKEVKSDYVIKKIDESTEKADKKHEIKNILDTSIIENFNQNSEAQNAPSIEKKEIVNFSKVLPEIKDGLVKLFGASCFDIDKIEVGKYSDECVLVELDGGDAALLIGKEGYRYKAISYLLHNWLNTKYNLSIRLEIAEFLKNQEATMDQYLCGIVEKVKNNGKAQTKPLDGVLVKIALAKLREKFPDKYVGIKSNGNDKFVVVNDFFKK